MPPRKDGTNQNYPKYSKTTKIKPNLNKYLILSSLKGWCCKDKSINHTQWLTLSVSEVQLPNVMYSIITFLYIHETNGYAINLIKGTIEKYTSTFFITCSQEDSKLNQYRHFQLSLPMHFQFMRYFVNRIIFRVSHRLLYFVFIKATLKNIKCLK